MACNNEPAPTEATADTAKETPAAAASVTMPYTPMYTTFTDDVSDNDVLTVLNSYKAWETGDMQALKATYADTTSTTTADGVTVRASADSVINFQKPYRDKISSVKINMTAWKKMHSVDHNEDWVCVWYDEIDTYKNGKVDSASYEDDNMLVNGKIAVYSTHKQVKK